MAYDEDLANRIRAVLSTVEVAEAVTERKMFGGLGFMVGGHLAVSASGQGGLMIRSDPATADQLIETTTAEAVVMKGRAMSGWLRVSTETVADEQTLRSWVEVGLSFVQSLPPKS